jgi:hypothetical protein
MFVIIEAIFTYKVKIISIPVTHDAIFQIANMMENSKDVIAFKVIDTNPVEPKHFGFGSDWKKWVTKFEYNHFQS